MHRLKHIGIIPDGNRRWAAKNNLSKDRGYSHGIIPGYTIFKLCQKENIEEVTFFGFTTDNTKRPAIQKQSFTKACIDSVNVLTKENCEILVVGNSNSDCFPKELKEFTERKKFGSGGIKVNFLINYGWKWDLSKIRTNSLSIEKSIASKDISRIDMIIRWGGRKRLSGFLPVQSVYSDFYSVEDYWPDFKEKDFYDALKWYEDQDITLGG
ncbi:undecaprenyl diphosphate synthase family protein [Clostridium sp. BJN0001]|uniref:undecaprenyl diphosphate synthase family protein n=1 Tax=Clostridium sp. BJN0001 TaxID=2930219 RepID=UPI001FD41791|nr:undecaprenyl diphosphate synthase family protein [Clostridium sp. BJN0001]